MKFSPKKEKHSKSGRISKPGLYDKVRAALAKTGGDRKEAAALCDVSSAVVNFVQRLDEKSGDQSEAFQKGLGHLSHRVAALVFLELKDRLEKKKKFSNQELAVLGGIASQRGMELLAKPGMAKEPTWAAIVTNIPRNGPVVDLPSSQSQLQHIRKRP